MSVQAKEATLRAMQVSIQALMVSGKQMTLAVFRQLPLGDVLASDGQLLARNYWGVVRYEIKESAEWVVYDTDETLYRAELPGNPLGPSRHRVDLLKAALAQWAEHVPRNETEKGDWFWRWALKWHFSDGPRPLNEDQCKDWLGQSMARYRRGDDHARNQSAAREVLMKLPQLFIAV